MPYANNYSFRGERNNRRIGCRTEEPALMPPEPLPWDRKGEFFRERRHGNGYERGYGYGYEHGHGHHHGNNIAGPGRWRDSSSSSSPFPGSRNNSEFSPRWGFPSSDFRRNPGHGKQGGWHIYSEDVPHGYSTPRSGDRFVDDDCFRPSGPRGDGRYGRLYRENRSGLGHRDWRGHSWENNHHYSGPASTPGRQHNQNEQRSVGVSPARPLHSNSDPNDQLQPKDHPDKTGDNNGSGTSQKDDKEKPLGSLDWKPLKWSRSGSLTSRGSGFSHSISSSKSTGGESGDLKCDLPLKRVTPVQSPSGDVAACAPAGVSSDETTSKKKPRLGWGEGLAKYEKKKVDGPEEHVNKVENTSVSNAEPTHSLTSNVADKSPKIIGFSDCSSPASPSSFACSSSPGLEEKTYGKTDGGGDANNFSVSSMPVPEVQPEGVHFSLEKLEVNSITNLSSLVSDLLQADVQCSMDSGFVRSSASNKLLVWKGDISKGVELTETEIDSLENELKLLKADSAQDCPCPGSASNSRVIDKNEYSNGQNGFSRPPVLDRVSSGNIVGDAHHHDHARGTRDIDSPGTATSKFVAASSLEKPIGACSADSGFVETSKSVTGNLLTCIGDEATVGTSCQGDGANGIRDDNVVAVVESPGFCDKNEGSICDIILASNKETAAEACEILTELLPSHDHGVDGLQAIGPTDMTIKEKFSRRKRHLRFKEKVMSMKYRAFRQLWKEDLRLLSLRSCRVKPQKHDLTSRTMQVGSQKHRQSIRSRFASPARSLSLVPTAEILNFTRKLLSDPQVKIYRNNLKMPAMILDEKEKMLSRFVSSNGLVEDPCAVEKERALINPWTTEEKEIFMEKLAALGKDFRKIASFLDHKTTADCVEFYYKNHKSKGFQKTKKLDVKTQVMPVSSECLWPSEKKWSRESIAASLDILGEASVIAAQDDQVTKRSELLPGKSSNRKARRPDGFIEASNRSSFYLAEDERETTAADVLAGICGSLSSEAMSSCITSSVDPGEGNLDLKHQKVGSSAKRRPLTPDVTQNVDDNYSDESCGERDPVDWTDDEKSLFVRAFSSHGKDFLMISRFVRTKTKDQCKVFFSKARKCLGLDTLHPGSSGEGILGSNDSKEGGSDIEDACVMETGSVTCSDKSGSRLDETLPHMNEDVSMPDASITDLNASEDKCGPGQSLDHKEADMEPEVLCPVDNLADSVRSAAADIQRAAEGCLNSQDDISKVDAAICVSAGLPPHVSSVVDPDLVSEANNTKRGTLRKDRDPSMSIAVVDSGDFHDGRLKQPTEYELQNPRCGSSSPNEGEASADLVGFPLDLSVKTELSDVIIHKAGPESNFSSFQECYFRKCSRLVSQSAASELPLLKKECQTNDPTGFSSSAETEKPCSSGDVKLFGKILSKPSSVDKPTSSAQRSDEKAKHHPSTCGKSNTKATCRDENTMHDHNGFVGLENVPIRSFGVWDGIGSPSALLLAKYPAAFGNYSSPSRTEQNSNQCNINGACVLSSREYSSINGSVIDYSVLNQEGVKQRQEAFPVLPRNGFEAIRSLQPQQKEFVKLNVVQGDVSCSQISDSVDALRLHYPGQQLGGGGHVVDGVIREDSWRDQGDLGR